MLSEFGFAKRVWSRCTALLVVAGFAACIDDSVAPAPEAAPPAKTPRVIGFAELTFTGIGTPDFSSSMLVAPTLEALEELRAQRERSGDLRDFVAQDLTLPRNQDTSGNGTIQLALDQSQEFPPVGGVRYLNATYSVRNAQLDSAAGSGYDTDRTNLTFLGVSSNNTVNQTAVRRLLLDGGTPAPEALALEVLPTDLVTATDTPLVAAHPDVLQIFREAEVAALTPPAGVTSVFPYGFVVRRVGSTTTRTLPASPPEGTFHGIVDFGFSIPAQPNSDQDPQTLSVLMLAVDDSETQLTQGPLEQTPEATQALRQLATLLNADTVTLLPGGTLPGDSVARTLCSVRTAGPAGGATAHLVNVDGSLLTVFPTPNSLISANATIGAAFSVNVQGAGPSNFIVRGLQSGQAFTGQTYSGNGTTTIETPAGAFSPGEEVEVVLTSELVCPGPQHVARYLVEAPSSTAFDTVSTSVGFPPRAVAFGNLRPLQPSPGLDMAVVHNQTSDVTVMWGQDDGTFMPGPTPTAGNAPWDVALGDMNGDTYADIVTVNAFSDDVSVLVNDGQGNFDPAPNSPVSVGETPQAVALGDLNGDGNLDIVAANNDLFAPSISVLLGNGDATFQPQQTYGTATGSRPTDAELGDLNGDGILDVVTADQGTTVSVFLGIGDGTFQNAQSHGVGTNSAAALAIGPLNADADNFPDIAVSHPTVDSVSVHFGDGQGGFTSSPTRINVPNLPREVALGTLEPGGNVDIVVPQQNGSSGLVLQGFGDGTFTPGRSFETQSNPLLAVVADIDGTNGALDIAVVNFDSGSITVVRAAP